MTIAATLEIRDRFDAAQIQVSLAEAGGGRRDAAPTAFALELSAEERATLDAYSAEYRRPTPGALPRVEAVEEVMRNLGRLLFETVFGAGNEGRAFLNEVMGREERAELAIVSPRPDFLSLPWELMNDPNLGYFIPNGLAGVVRQASLEIPKGEVEERTDDALNVLMLSASPLEGRPPAQGGLVELDAVAGGNLATATVAALEGLNVEASLDNPRPATLAALRRLLERNQNHYHIAHIDGATLDADGAIVLEDESGAPSPTPSAELGKALADGGVNVALLSAGAQPDNAGMAHWSAAATEIANAGVAQVAVLPAPLHPDTAEAAMRAFYTRLSQGNAVATAVASVRRGLMDSPERVSVYGKRVFWDWQLPAVYQSERYMPAVIAQHQPDPLAPPVIHPEEAPTEDLQIPAQGQHGLVGRQAELRQLERALQANAVVLLAGDTGVGKTELALGLCRWFLKPARVVYPGGVFYTAFEASQLAGIERVVHEIGTAVAGLNFADMPAGQQRQWVTEYLQQNPSLLVWDNVENVAGFPDGSAGLLDESELPGLAAFLGEATTGPVGTAALLLSRRDAEGWLTIPYASLRLEGLTTSDRFGLVAALMDNAEVPEARAGADLGELLNLLEGHPLAMQMAIPPVKEVPASVVATELQRLMAEQADGGEPGRSTALSAAMEYSFSRMSRRNRTHLPFLALFQRRVMLDVLSHITEEQAYGQVLGNDLASGASRSLLTPDGSMQSSGRSYAACRTLLRQAQSAGFLEPVSPSVYQINPALPWFLGRKLGGQVSGDGIRQLEGEFVRVYADTADYFMESLYENQDAGVTAVLAEEGNVTQALGLALEYRQWDNAQILMQPLAQVYRMQKRFPELRRLRGQLLDVVGHTAAEAEGNGAIEFWQYLLGTDAMESVELRELDRAEGFNEQLLAYLLGQPDGETDARTAAVYHQNGLIATRRGRYDEATEWLEKGLEIIDGGEDQESIADACFAIGQVRHHQRQYGSAKEWYSRALDIHQRLPDYEEMVNDFRALGSACHLRFEYDEARSWYHRAREMVEDNRDEETAVYIFHALGTVDHSEYLFEDAQSWYQQALGLCDRMGMTEQMIVEFHHLGTLAQARGIPDEAEEWLTTAMEYRERLGDVRGAGVEARQLGVVFHEQGNLEQAYRWYDQARTAFEGARDVLRAARTYGQLGMVEEERGNLPEALEWVARTYQLVVQYELPMLVQVKAHLARLRDAMGEEDFGQWWRDNTGAEAPTDLDVDTSEIL
ncbi:MAG: tetratricopeptide repeat protein [Chloroflexi bacterium]|nr:tetratricopeptide repeat protein [Chloroflexota bacterium]MYD49419.1 tetratricopeptide repeat protein [Chloroflexota bacterium]